LIRITQQEKLLQIVSETHETFGRRIQTEMVGLREGLDRVEERDDEGKEKRRWKEIVNEIERKVVGIGREVERVGRMVEGNREKLDGMEGKGNDMVMRLKLELEKETGRIALF
jgi:CRISPR/Cas system CSM-associated protein Csm2 small subunit